MFNKFIRFCVAVLLVLFTAYSAFAGESRVKSLGEQELYTVDDTDIFSNPALCHRYPQILRLHAGGGNPDMYAYGGFNVAPFNGLTVGAFFGRHPEYEEGGIKRIIDRAVNDAGQFVDEFGYFVEGGLPTNDAVEWQNPVDLLVSYNTGNTAFGIGYYTANGKYSKDDDSPDDAKWKKTDYEIESRIDSVKMGTAFTTGRWTTEIWAEYTPYEIDSDWEADGVASADDERSRMVLRGRRWAMGARVLYRVGEGLYLVPALRWEKSEGEVSYDTFPDYDLPDGTSEEGLDQDYAVSDLEAGLGLRWGSRRIFLVGSASVDWSKERYEFTEPYGDFFESKETIFTALPVIGLGMDCRILSWLSLRWGMKTTAFLAETTVHDRLKDYNRPRQDWKRSSRVESVRRTIASVGLGLKFGNLSVDAVAGGFVLAGEQGIPVAGEGPAVFSGLDVKYSFR